MILPLLIIAGSIFGSLGATSIAGQAVIGGELYGAKKRNKKHEKDNRLGLNPEYAKFKAERLRAMFKQLGSDPKQVQEGFVFLDVDIPAMELDETKKWMAGAYLLTEQEKDQLIEALMEDITSIDVVWLQEVSKRRRAEQI